MILFEVLFNGAGAASGVGAGCKIAVKEAIFLPFKEAAPFQFGKGGMPLLKVLLQTFRANETSAITHATLEPLGVLDLRQR